METAAKQTGSPFRSMPARKPEAEDEDGPLLSTFSPRTRSGAGRSGRRRRALPYDEYQALEEAWLRGVVEAILSLPADDEAASVQGGIKATRGAAGVDGAAAAAAAGGRESAVSRILTDFLRPKPSGLTGKACTQLVKSVSAAGRPELALQVFADLYEYGRGRPHARE